MKIALLTTKSRISPVFETTCSSLIVDAEKNQCEIQSTYFFTSQNEIEMVNEILSNNIQLLICGAIPYYIEKRLINEGCHVLSFIAGEIGEVLQALCCDLLDDSKFKMPGCKKRKRIKFFSLKIT